MNDRVREQVTKILKSPKGLLVVCGPTDSGKTTTVYSLLHALDRFQRSVFTIEEQIEARLPNVNQIRLDARPGRSMVGELKGVLRQEANVIFISEVRDSETAELACDAARERLIITSLSVGDTMAALFRLLDLGVPPARLAGVLLGLLAPRLLRIVCPRCRIKYRPNPEMVRKANLLPEKAQFFYRPPEDEELRRDASGRVRPCKHCEGSGYYGRTAVFEFLLVNDRLRDLIREKATFNTIKQEAVKNGLVYLLDEALRLVTEGVTSVAEVLRVLK